METLKSLKDYLPLASILLILAGVFNIDNYYSRFGIDIITYLDATEVLFSFASIYTRTVLPIIILGLLFVYYFNYKYVRMKKNIEKVVEILDKENPEEESIATFNTSLEKLRNEARIKIYLFLVVTILFNIFISHSDIFIRIHEFAYSFLYLLIILFLGVILFSYNTIKKSSASVPIFFKFETFFIITIILFSAMYVRNEIKATNLTKGYAKHSVILRLDDLRSISTNDSIMFVGSTRNYYFFHNRNSKLNKVIAASKVKEVLQKELRTGI